MGLCRSRASCRKCSALVGAGLVVELVNCEELHDPNAAELLRAGALAGCWFAKNT